MNTLDRISEPAAAERTSAGPRTMLFWTVFAGSFLPLLSALLPTDSSSSHEYRIASVVGLVALLALEWQVVLGVRQVTAALRVDRGLAIRVHTVLGVTSAVVVILHPLLWRAAQDQPLTFLWQLEWGFTESRFISLGRIAVALFLVIWLTSTVTRYALSHRWWRALHVLAYPMVLLAFVHSWAATGVLAEQPAVRVYWWATALATAVAIGVRIVAPWLVRPSSITATRSLNGGVALRLAGGASRLRIEPGQFVSLRAGRWRSSHPYSVIAREPDGAVWLAIGAVGRQSTQLGALTVGDRVWADGGHGTFTADSPGRQTRVFIAAGYGITPFLWRVGELPDVDDTHLYQLVRRRADALFEPQIRDRLGDRYHLVARDARARFSVAEITPRLLAQATFWICGDPAFAERIQSDLRGAGVARRRIRIEYFG